MSVFRRLTRIDVRLIYLVLAVSILLPMFFPVGIPVAKSVHAIRLYDEFRSLPEGSAVIFSADFPLAAKVDLKPMIEVMVDLALQKGYRLIVMGLWEEGAGLIAEWTQPIFARHEAVYGVDYIIIGYVPQPYDWLEKSRKDIREAWHQVDAYGKPLAGFSVLEGIDSAQDITAVLSFSYGDPGYVHWMQYWRATGVCDCVYALSSEVNMVVTWLQQALYSASSIQGIVRGLGGAATLEAMHGVVGGAHAEFDMQSFAHLTILFFVILGNIGYLGRLYKIARHRK